jgi:GNAT superfamily N-acetyltransferase
MVELTGIDRIEFHELNAKRWPDFVQLFESRGGPKSCWCMVWRATGEEAKHTDGASRKSAMAQRVFARVPVGLLGYLDSRPVAWCSVAPRSTYRRLVDGESADEGIWSIVCFFVMRRLRGQGITMRMIKAAVDYAKENGASVIEAYPVDSDSPSYRFMGFIHVFEKAGFIKTGRAGKRRYVMRLE